MIDALRWFLILHGALLTAILVPLGVLLHYWRRADARELVIAPAAERGIDGLPDARRQVRLGRSAAAVASGAIVLSIVGVGLPNPTSDGADAYLVPLAIVSVCLAALFLVPALRPANSGAGGDVRTAAPPGARPPWRSLVRSWWFRVWGISGLVLAVTVVLAGLASSPDEEGRYAVIAIELDTMTGRSSFPGWYYGIPVLVGAAVLAAVILVTLSVGSRSTVAAPAGTAHQGASRNRCILALSCGAELLTLGWLWTWIGAAAAMTVGDLAEEAVGTPFAALSTPLRMAGLLLEGLGFAMILLPLMSKRPRCVPLDDESHLVASGLQPSP